MNIDSRAASNRILPQINMPDTRHPDVLIVRLRHLSVKPIKSVTINGREWTDFDVQKEWLQIKNPDRNQYSILASYQAA